MKNIWTYRIIFWCAALILVTGLLLSFVPHWTLAWMLATFLMPSALFGRWISGIILRNKLPWRYWLYVSIGVLWFAYMGAIGGYWLLFELDPDQFPEVLINPVFSFIWVGAFTTADLLLERHYFPSSNDTPAMVQFVSERKNFEVREDAILFIESRDRFTIVHTSEKDYPTTTSITAWSEQLPNFIRTHRSILLNPVHVVSTSKTSVTLSHNGRIEEVPVSRSYGEKITLIPRKKE